MKGFMKRFGKSQVDSDKGHSPRPEAGSPQQTDSNLTKWQSTTVTPSESAPLINNQAVGDESLGGNVDPPHAFVDISRKQKCLAWGETIFTGLKSISEANAVLAPLKAVCGIMKTILHTIQELEKNKRDWMEILQTLRSHYDTFITSLEQITAEDAVDDKNSAFFAPISAYCHQLENLLADLMSENGITSSTVPSNYQNTKNYMKDYGTTAIERDRIKMYSERLNNAIQEFKVSMMVYTAFELHAATQKLRQIDAKLMATSDTSLIPSYGRTGPHGAQHTTCLEGTRVSILSEIDSWSKDESQPRVFIISDEAGTGKSTIAKHVSTRWVTENRLAARFFFTRDHKGTSTASDLCLFIPNDASFMHPDIQEIVEDVLDDQEAIARKPIAEQWNRLVFRPFALLPGGLFVVVIDALDECTDDTRSTLFSCILETFTSSSSSLRNIRILITLRPEPDLMDVIAHTDPTAAKLTHLCLSPQEKDASRKDLAIYIHHRFNNEAGFELSEDDYGSLVQKSEGLFIFAVMACALLMRTYSPRELLCKILSTNQSTPLQALYEDID